MNQTTNYLSGLELWRKCPCFILSYRKTNDSNYDELLFSPTEITEFTSLHDLEQDRRENREAATLAKIINIAYYLGYDLYLTNKVDKQNQYYFRCRQVVS